MSKGLSFESFEAIIDVTDSTLDLWVKKHPEFLAAKKKGRALQRVFYEKLGVLASSGKIASFNATAFVWMTKNMLHWKDHQSIEHSGPNGGPIEINQDFQKYTTEELIEAYQHKKQLPSKGDQKP